MHTHMYRKSASDSAVLHPPCSRMGFLCMEDVWMQCLLAPQPYGPRSSTYTTAHWHLAIGTLHLTAVTTGHLNEARWRQHLQSTLGISKHYVIIYHRDLGIHWEMPFHQPLLQLHSAHSSAQAPSSHPNAQGKPTAFTGRWKPYLLPSNGWDLPEHQHRPTHLPPSLLTPGHVFCIIFFHPLLLHSEQQPATNNHLLLARHHALSCCQHWGLWALQLPQASYSEPAMQTHDFTPCLIISSYHCFQIQSHFWLNFSLSHS